MDKPQLFACPVCGADDTRKHRDDVEDFEYHVVPQRHFMIARCDACGSDFLYPRPTGDEIASFYPDDYHAYHDDHTGVARLLVQLRSRGRAAFYKKLIGERPGRLFDVGAGDCRHFDALKPYCQLEFSGVEIKPEIAQRARDRGYDIETGMLETMDLTRHLGQYDIVSMNHVIEHVIDPQEMMRRTFTILTPGGVVIGQLPARDSWEERIAGRYWAGYHFPRHLQAFSYLGLEKLLARSGFIDIAVTSAPHVQSAISVQNRLIATGWRPTMRYGKTPIFSLIILAVLPFETIAWLSGNGSIMNFVARKPQE